MAIQYKSTLNGSFPGSADLDDLYVRKDYFNTGNLWMWGNNYLSSFDSGQLGDNTTADKSSPVQTVAGGTNWKQVAAGGRFSAGIKSDGTLWLWGSNGQGELGINAGGKNSSPVQTVAGGNNWKQVSLGSSFAAAIKTDGTLWLWGSNSFGGLGDNTTTRKSSPVQTVAGGTNWKQVSCGGNEVTASIKTDGTLWLWGDNALGQLGDNTSTAKSSPVQTVAGGTNWKQVSCGGTHAGAIKTDGTLWAWGFNAYGQLGDNTSTAKSSPVQTVAGGTNWKQVSAGERFTAAIKTNGTLWAWGRNSYGQLGIGNTSNRSSPVQTIALGTNWKQIADPVGSDFTAAIKTDGTLWMWGRNGQGQLGDNSVTFKSSPVQTITAGTTWKQVSCGSAHTGTIKE